MKQIGLFDLSVLCSLALLAAFAQACSASDGGQPTLRGASGTGGTAAGGSANVGGTAGTSVAGSSTGGNGTSGSGASGNNEGGSQSGGGAGGAVAGGGGLGGGGGNGPAPCPADAFFCSGFEDAGLPTGATYLSSNDNNDWTKGTVLDKTVHHGGAQSIEILKSMSYSQREIVVPAAVTFWFRVYLQTDVMIGGPDGANHNLFLEAAYPGGDKGVEIVEEDCELGMNINDTRYGSNGMVNQNGCPAAPATQLVASTWHCLEGYFDGTKGDFRLFANGSEVITQTGVAGAKQQFNALRFGYREYHPHDRVVWYDDVATAPGRIGCQ